MIYGDLPGQVDTDERAGLFGEFGINSVDLIATFADGDGSHGGVGGALGKLVSS